MLTHIITAIVFLALGYVLRKYVEKKWPTQVKAADEADEAAQKMAKVPRRPPSSA